MRTMKTNRVLLMKGVDLDRERLTCGTATQRERTKPPWRMISVLGESGSAEDSTCERTAETYQRESCGAEVARFV